MTVSSPERKTSHLVSPAPRPSPVFAHLAVSVYPSLSNSAMSLRATSRSHPISAFVIPASTTITFPLILYAIVVRGIRSAAPSTTPRTSTLPLAPPVGRPNPSQSPALIAARR